MSSADLMMLLTRESEKCLRESLVAKFNADATAAASNMNGQAAVEHSPSKSVANDCYSLVAVFSHTVVFSCRRHVLHTALEALANSAERLGRSIDTDFPYQVAAGDNLGTPFEVFFIICSSSFFRRPLQLALPIAAHATCIAATASCAQTPDAPLRPRQI